MELAWIFLRVNHKPSVGVCSKTLFNCKFGDQWEMDAVLDNRHFNRCTVLFVRVHDNAWCLWAKLNFENRSYLLTSFGFQNPFYALLSGQFSDLLVLGIPTFLQSVFFTLPILGWQTHLFRKVPAHPSGPNDIIISTNLNNDHHVFLPNKPLGYYKFHDTPMQLGEHRIKLVR